MDCTGFRHARAVMSKPDKNQNRCDPTSTQRRDAQQNDAESPRGRRCRSLPASSRIGMMPRLTPGGMCHCFDGLPSIG